MGARGWCIEIVVVAAMLTVVLAGQAQARADPVRRVPDGRGRCTCTGWPAPRGAPRGVQVPGPWRLEQPARCDLRLGISIGADTDCDRYSTYIYPRRRRARIVRSFHTSRIEKPRVVFVCLSRRVRMLAFAFNFSWQGVFMASWIVAATRRSRCL